MPFELTSGAVLGDGRYRLQRRLGSGGMATVWLAGDEHLSRAVAVKVISDALAADGRYRERFAREARAAASVAHPNIVPVYDYGQQGERPFLVMEYVPGGSLAAAISNRNPEALDPTAVAVQLLDALECIHEAGLLHRDVKPANILLDVSGRARLTDFGIAQLQDATSLTQTGMVLGTLRYLAPEIVAGGKPGPAADLYAAGVVLRELTELQPAPKLTALITALTAPDPTDRPASARAAMRLSAGEKPTSSSVTASRPGDAATPPTRRPATVATRRIANPARPAPDPARPPVRDISRRAIGAGAAAIVLVLVLLLSLTGGSSPTSNRTTGAPAPAGAPLTDQLHALQQLVDETTRR
ncbi:MAG: serine/threonine-protein kinase [Solirubrobacteraceae bacterium]